MPVPSPTFVMKNTYSTERGLFLHHYDLYRLPSPATQTSFSRLELDESLHNAVSLIEWPDRLPQGLLVYPHLEVHIKLLSRSDQMKLEQCWVDDGQPCNGALALDTEPCAEGEFQDVQWRSISLVAQRGNWQQRIAEVAATLNLPSLNPGLLRQHGTLEEHIPLQ
jgi:Threonylcarbamoyl adenosine biosynthesis protein TsaE